MLLCIYIDEDNGIVSCALLENWAGENIKGIWRM